MRDTLKYIERLNIQHQLQIEVLHFVGYHQSKDKNHKRRNYLKKRIISKTTKFQKIIQKKNELNILERMIDAYKLGERRARRKKRKVTSSRCCRRSRLMWLLCAYTEYERRYMKRNMREGI